MVVSMNTRVIILAAGKGTRMKALLPKPLIPVAGKPMLQRLVESVHASQIDVHPVVVIGKERRPLCETFGDTSCVYAVQEEQRGTAHAVQCAQSLVGEAEHVIVLQGDHPFVTPKTLHRLTQSLEQEQAVVVATTTTVPDFLGWHAVFAHWGRILRDAKGNLIGIREYKDATEEERQIQECNAGMYAFDAAWLWQHLGSIRNSNASQEYYLTDLLALAVQEGAGVSLIEADPEEVIGVNTPEELAIAESLAQDRGE